MQSLARDTLHDVLKRKWEIRDKSTPYVFHNADGTRYTFYQKRSTMRKLCRKAGVKVFSFHAIRHPVAAILADWVFQTGCLAPGFTRNDRGTSRPCLLPPMAVKSKPPAMRVVVDSGKANLSQIQKMLRHRRITTADNYIKTLDPQLRQVANVLDEQGKDGEKTKSGTIGRTI